MFVIVLLCPFCGGWIHEFYSSPNQLLFTSFNILAALIVLIWLCNNTYLVNEFWRFRPKFISLQIPFGSDHDWIYKLIKRANKTQDMWKMLCFLTLYLTMSCNYLPPNSFFTPFRCQMESLDRTLAVNIILVSCLVLIFITDTVRPACLSVRHSLSRPYRYDCSITHQRRHQ